MKPLSVSPAFTRERVAESRDFYVEHLGARVTFDCGWYVNLAFGNSGQELQFMSPQKAEHKLTNPAGLIYNFHVEEVDKEYDRLTAAGLATIIPLEDHPWGDRGFGIQDPNGITLYVYSEREPSEEFKRYYRE